MLILYSAVHKRRPHSGKGVARCVHFADKGWGGCSDTDVGTFWCKKPSDFLICMVCMHEQEGKR